MVPLLARRPLLHLPVASILGIASTHAGHAYPSFPRPRLFISSLCFLLSRHLLVPFFYFLRLPNDFLPYISCQATQSFVGKRSRAKSVCALLNVGVKLGNLSRYAHLYFVNMVL